MTTIEIEKKEKLKFIANKLAINTYSYANKHLQVVVCLAIIGSAFFIAAMFPEIALAGKFDINAGVKAATDPLIKAVDDHWGKAVLLTGCAGAVIGEGDARQRAVRAAITSVAAGGVVLALLAMLT